MVGLYGWIEVEVGVGATVAPKRALEKKVRSDLTWDLPSSVGKRLGEGPRESESGQDDSQRGKNSEALAHALALSSDKLAANLNPCCGRVSFVLSMSRPFLI